MSGTEASARNRIVRLLRLPKLRSHRRRRVSSYDRTGGNKDYIVVPAGETAVLAEMEGARKVNHIWVTIRSKEDWYLRKLVLKAYWDGEEEPSIIGTGTEDYYGMSWCPTQEYCAPYHGLPIPGGKNWSGKVTWYRYHIPDPVYFEKSIRVTIEHGHANHRSDDYSSTAYWYQTEPHKPFSIAPVEERIPRK